MDINRLIAQAKFGASMGLQRVQAVIEHLEPAFNAIKVTGSNGKGSTSRYLSHLLGALAIDHGLFTSPHLFKFNERISVNGQDISDESLHEACTWFEHYQQQYLTQHPEDTLGAFEAFTALALYYFSHYPVKNLILEAGIGGRFDSTRAVNGDFVALTSLDLEHCDLLGDTLEEIAYNKIDLCPDGGTLVLGKIANPELVRKIAAYCALKQLRLLIAAEHCPLLKQEQTEKGMLLDFNFQQTSVQNVKVSLSGEHQISNLQVAIVLGWYWCQRYQPKVDVQQFLSVLPTAFADVVWPGRFEKISNTPPIYIDVAHSPDAVKHLVATVKQNLAGQKILLVLGVSGNKAIAKIANGLLDIADAVICTRAYHRGAALETIYEQAKQYRPELEIQRAANIETAMKMATAYALKHQMTILVAGGLFLAIEARQTVFGLSPEELNFF